MFQERKAENCMEKIAFKVRQFGKPIKGFLTAGFDFSAFKLLLRICYMLHRLEGASASHPPERSEVSSGSPFFLNWFAKEVPNRAVLI